MICLPKARENKSLKIKDFVSSTTKKLKNIGIPHPRKETETLLSHALQIEKRENLYLQFERKLKISEEKKALSLLSQRVQGTPIEYVVGQAFFYQSTFFVNPHVLIPRTETEDMLRAALQWAKTKSLKRECLRVLDMGAGSGSIGLSFIKEMKKSHLVAVDCSKEALKVLNLNSENLGVQDQVTVLCQKVEELKVQNLPDFFEKKMDVILANPPYIDENILKQKTEKSQFKYTELKIENFVEESVLKYEPPLALFAPQRGFYFLSLWSKLALSLLDSPSLYCVEVGHSKQAEKLKEELERVSFFDKISIRKDGFKRERFLFCEKRG